jgi:hypothetical protein
MASAQDYVKQHYPAAYAEKTHDAGVSTYFIYTDHKHTIGRGTTLAEAWSNAFTNIENEVRPQLIEHTFAAGAPAPAGHIRTDRKHSMALMQVLTSMKFLLWIVLFAVMMSGCEAAADHCSQNDVACITEHTLVHVPPVLVSGITGLFMLLKAFADTLKAQREEKKNTSPGK